MDLEWKNTLGPSFNQLEESRKNKPKSRQTEKGKNIHFDFHIISLSCEEQAKTTCFSILYNGP